MPVSYLDSTGALADHVVSFNGVNYTPRYPVAALSAGTLLGRASEINVTGATTTLVGNRMNINVASSALTGTSGNGLLVTPTTVTLSQATTASGGAMPAYPSSNPTFLFLRGDGLWAIPPGTGGGGGGGTMNSWRSQLVNQFGAVQSTVNITDNFVEQFQAGTGIDITHTNLGGGARFTISLAAGAGYTHPPYTPYNFMPSLVGSTLTVPAITTDAIGSVTNITSQAFVLPSGGGGLVGTSGNGLTVTANTVSLALVNTSSPGATPTLPNNANLFLNGVGAWVAPPSGGGAVTSVTSGNPTALTVSPTTGGVVVTPNGQSTTLNNAWNPTTRILSLPVGVYQGGVLTSSSLAFYDLSVASSANTVEVRYNDVTINPAAAIINFKGAGVTSVTNGVGTEITISGGSGGVTSFNGNTGAINLVSGTNTSVVALGGGTFRVDATGGGGGGSSLIGFSGNGLAVFPDNVSLAIASTTSAGAMPVLSGNSAQYLSGAGTWVNVPSVGSAVTSVTSGNAAVLNVAPTTGNVIITPTGTTASFFPAFNTFTKTLSLPNQTHNGGLLSSQGTTLIDLSSLAGTSGVTSLNGLTGILSLTSTNGLVVTPTGSNVRVNLPTNGVWGETLYYDLGTNEWKATSKLSVNPSTSQAIINMDGGGAQVRISAGTFGVNANGVEFTTSYTDIGGLGALRMNGFPVNINLGTSNGTKTYLGRVDVSGSNAGIVATENGTDLTTAKLSFYGATPITRPSTTNDITSVRNALIALGLIS